jgi:hypothetical protein
MVKAGSECASAKQVTVSAGPLTLMPPKPSKEPVGVGAAMFRVLNALMENPSSASQNALETTPPWTFVDDVLHLVTPECIWSTQNDKMPSGGAPSAGAPNLENLP